MKRKTLSSILGGTDVREPIKILGKNLYLRLLSVYDSLVCDSISTKLNEKLIEDGINSEVSKSVAENACLAYMCLYDRRNKRIFESGLDAANSLTAEELLKVAEEYVRVRDSFLNFNNLNAKSILELKKKLDTPRQRIRWKVLKEFNVLPTSKEAKEMCDGDYLYCYINMMLDDEEYEDYEFEVNENFDSSILENSK